MFYEILVSQYIDIPVFYLISEQGTPTNFSSEKPQDAQVNLPLAMDQLLGIESSLLRNSILLLSKKLKELRYSEVLFIDMFLWSYFVNFTSLQMLSL